jgi:hypothetical protein
MITYQNRRDKRYLDTLRNMLSIDALVANAVELPFGNEYRHIEGKTYQKRCDIAFIGLSANTLFDRTNRYLSSDGVMVDKMEEIFKRHDDFMKANIWLRIRCLLLYPYSTHALSIINAESNVRRCAMIGECVHPSMQRKMHVSQDQFYASSLYNGQKNTLNLIQEWMEKYNWKNRRGNSISVRFTPVSPNLCGLIVNNKAFCDSYILAKERRGHKRLVFSSPLTEIDRQEDDLAFRSLENHLNYLWQLNITLDCGDATQYEWGKQDSLGSINRPNSITFFDKSARLVKRGYITEKESNNWRLMTKKQFDRYIALPTEDNPHEKIFISCSWKADTHGNMEPNEIASNIEKWLKEDITESIPKLLPVIMRGDVGDDLSQTLYNLLDTSMLGIVLLTDDVQIKDEQGMIVERSSRTNVYHELGYLMGRLEDRDSYFQGRKKVFIALEKGVKIATNVGVKLHAPIESGEELKARKAEVSLTQSCYLYTRILVWLNESSLLLEKQVFQNALASHKLRINEAGRELEKGDQNRMIENINKLIAHLKSKNTIAV